jgi:hypothetical protein
MSRIAHQGDEDIGPAASLVPTVLAGRAKLAALACCAVVLGCARPTVAPTDSSPADGTVPDAVITINGERHVCIVAVKDRSPDHWMACDAVVAFLQDEIKLRAGAVYDIRTVPDVDEADIHRLSKGLKIAGYHYLQGPHVMLLTGPHRNS